MPLIEHSAYAGPPIYQFNGHLQTILPAILRKVKTTYERERINLSDGDFLDLDWLCDNNDQLAILTHGLEGNTDRHYMKGMANYLFNHAWDVLGWNCRTCSGEMNTQLRMYNHGDIEDIGEVVHHALSRKGYRKIVLIGFSMGGSILMKYLGVNGKEVPEAVKAGIAYSSPCDLAASVAALEFPANLFYKKRFLRSLRPKIEAKAKQFPDVIDASNLDRVEKWKDFDNFFSAPINGYKDADDFYEQASAKNFMEGTNRPILLVNAINDPILPPVCSPVELCKKHPLIFLEMPRRGGHVGFTEKKGRGTWSERRTLEFLEQRS